MHSGFDGAGLARPDGLEPGAPQIALGRAEALTGHIRHHHGPRPGRHEDRHRGPGLDFLARGGIGTRYEAFVHRVARLLLWTGGFELEFEKRGLRLLDRRPLEIRDRHERGRLDDREVDRRPAFDLVSGRRVLLDDRSGLLRLVGRGDGGDGAHLESGLLDLADRLSPLVAHDVRYLDRHRRLRVVVEQGRGEEPEQRTEERDQHQRHGDRHPVVSAFGLGGREHLGRLRGRAIQHLRRPGGEQRRRVHRQPALGALEIGPHLLGRLVAVRRVLRECTQDHGVEIGGHVRVELRRGHGLLEHLLRGDRDGRVAEERRPAGDHLVHHAPERVEVRTRVDRLALGLLRRQVRRGAEDRGRLRDRVGGRRDPRDAEVRDLHLATRVQHDVAGLDVAMDHSPGVCGLERLAHIHRDVDRAVRQDAAAAGQELGERATLHVLHHDVVHAVVRAGVEHRDDVRVPDARGGLRFAAEALHEPVVVGELRCEDLHGDGSTQHRVRAEEDLGHAAPAELALDAVTPSEGHR